ncbi:hypothetical protein GIB67_026251 [Kingdonia uniflora]|uniref:Uncharacterized protein n=1 Tax=Kingdonia uniflora TaxID=39325 RepID=A0A7J7LA15_9MAGN|nr:hypothetical protein GIB67_026251 [Kingdonia uniflora]
MSPEYAMQRKFSKKSDVLSFGVLLLKIVAGKKNTNIHDYGESLSLLGYTWKSWKENRVEEIVHPDLSEPCFLIEILRCVQVGLLYLQNLLDDRPTMSSILSMLTSKTTTLPTPKEPFTKWGWVILLFSERALLDSQFLRAYITLKSMMREYGRKGNFRSYTSATRRLSSLQFLMIGECEKLTSLPSKEEMGCLTILRRLKICHCPLLKIMCLKDCGTFEDDEMKVESKDKSDDLIEYNLKLLGEDVVEHDNDSPQKVNLRKRLSILQRRFYLIRHRLLSSSYIKIKKLNVAIRDANAALEVFSTYCLGKLEKAIEHLAEAILLNLASAIIYGIRASVYIKMKKLNVAIRDANVALKVLITSMTNSPSKRKNDDKYNKKILEAHIQPNHLKDEGYSGVEAIKYLHSYIFKGHEKT